MVEAAKITVTLPPVSGIILQHRERTCEAERRNEIEPKKFLAIPIKVWLMYIVGDGVSSPAAINGWIPEWPKGTDCKSAANCFGGFESTSIHYSLT